MNEFWPWWLGALGLAGVTIGFWAVLDRPLGVSGSWARLLRWRDNRAHAHANAQMKGIDIDDALMRATLAEFGDQAIEQVGGGSATKTTSSPSYVAPRATWTSHLIFLAAMGIGGLLSTLSTGQLEWQPVLHTTHQAFFGDGLGMWLVLVGGGMLVGFGTQLGGGCSSGHGLSGCSNLVPASLAATAIFFTTAVATSLLLESIRI